MLKNNLKFWTISAVALLLCNVNAEAQMFGNDNDSAPVKTTTERNWQNNSQVYNGGSAAAQRVPATTNQNRQTPATKAADNRSTQAVVPVLKPTLDGVKRGPLAMGEVVSTADGTRIVDVSSIFLYYSNYSVRKGLAGGISCDVRFIVMSTLDRKLSNLSVKLKWPGIETALNFNDVVPNVENYFDYTLVGEGCYTMDKIPNIIVNRCRVSRMSSQECASKIRWLKKQ